MRPFQFVDIHGKVFNLAHIVMVDKTDPEGVTINTSDGETHWLEGESAVFLKAYFSAPEQKPAGEVAPVQETSQEIN